MKAFEKRLTSETAWVRRHALEEISRMAEQLVKGEYTVEDGVLYNRLHRVAVKDVYDVVEYLGVVFDREATDEARAEETTRFLEDYRKRMENYEPDDETLYEMRAAFGEGARVVDAITGKVIQL